MKLRLAEILSATRRHLTTIIFLFGFISDSFLLPEIDNPITKYLGLSYLLGLALLILMREWIVSRNTATKTEERIFSLITFGVSFLSGSALSFVFVYAMRSAALAVSWPLFVVLLISMVANEFIATHNYRFTLDIGVFFIALVFYAIFNVPILFGEVNDAVFLIALAIATGVGILFIWSLRNLSETAEYEQGRGFALAIGVPLFVGMLYLLNIIPAVPLSLKQSGVYHSIVKANDGAYIGKIEEDTRLFASLRTPIYHLSEEDNGIYFFSSIQAPAQVSSPITHVWEYKNPDTGRWGQLTTVPFTLSGGRNNGYRAYSYKENVYPGTWRVTVKADTKRVVGRFKFVVVEGEPERLVEVKR